MVDVICFLCREENLLDPSAALRAPVTDLLVKVGVGGGIVRHLEPHSRFVLRFRFDLRLMLCFIYLISWIFFFFISAIVLCVCLFWSVRGRTE